MTKRIAVLASGRGSNFQAICPLGLLLTDPNSACFFQELILMTAPSILKGMVSLVSVKCRSLCPTLFNSIRYYC
jgi:hypothetical protein